MLCILRSEAAGIESKRGANSMPSPPCSMNLNSPLPFAAKKKYQLDNQNDHHQHLEHERPALVKLVHHELVQFAGRIELAVHQFAVILHTHLICCQTIQPG